jgi:hypothetical protein
MGSELLGVLLMWLIILTAGSAMLHPFDTLAAEEFEDARQEYEVSFAGGAASESYSREEVARYVYFHSTPAEQPVDLFVEIDRPSFTLVRRNSPIRPLYVGNIPESQKAVLVSQIQRYGAAAGLNIVEGDGSYNYIIVMNDPIDRLMLQNPSLSSLFYEIFRSYSRSRWFMEQIPEGVDCYTESLLSVHGYITISIIVVR